MEIGSEAEFDDGPARLGEGPSLSTNHQPRGRPGARIGDGGPEDLTGAEEVLLDSDCLPLDRTASSLEAAETTIDLGPVVSTPATSTPAPRKIQGYQLSRQAVALWSLGLIFLMVWVFALGIMVGRGSIFQNQVVQDLVDRTVGIAPPRSAPLIEVARDDQTPAATTPGDTKLTFYDSLSQAPKHGSQSKVPPASLHDPAKAKASPAAPARVEPTASAKNPEPSTKSSEATKVKAIEPIKHPAEPVTKPKPSGDTATKATEPTKHSAESGTKSKTSGESAAKTTEQTKAKPTETSKPVDPLNPQPPSRKPGENFSIQIATTSSPEEAAKLVSGLKAKGFDAYHYFVETNGKKYYRIRVGRYGSREEAKPTAEKLGAAGHRNLYISTLND